jgi:hypothetical protein
MCPQITPGIEPSGTNTEQIKDAVASPERRPGAWLVAAAGDDGPGRDAGCGIGAGGGEAGAAEAAAGMVIVF